MHKIDDITLKNISKVEGHAHLTVKIEDEKVQSVQLKVAESKRFFNEAIRGKDFLNVPQHVSRICGTCSASHLICSIEAVEKAIKFKSSPQTIVLRKLALNGAMIRDHAMHLYLFCLPDIFGKDSVLEFSTAKEKGLVHEAFHVKAAGGNLTQSVGGRAVHPFNIVVGGFQKIPSREQLDLNVAELNTVRGMVLNLIELFFENDFSFKTKSTNFVALCNEDYSFLEGMIKTSKNVCVPEENYWNHLHSFVLPYSTAEEFEFEGEEFMVGALSRLNLNREALHSKTKKDCQKFLHEFPSTDVFNNNLAQAIEILHCIDASIELIESNEFSQEPVPELKPKMADGIGVIEAPRGTLYYSLSLNADGKIRYGNLVIPTAQNNRNLEADIKEFVEKNISKPREWVEKELEKLIRAYDPCMSCATHFLKVKWK